MTGLVLETARLGRNFGKRTWRKPDGFALTLQKPEAGGNPPGTYQNPPEPGGTWRNPAETWRKPGGNLAEPGGKKVSWRGGWLGVLTMPKVILPTPPLQLTFFPPGSARFRQVSAGFRQVPPGSAGVCRGPLGSTRSILEHARQHQPQAPIVPPRLQWTLASLPGHLVRLLQKLNKEGGTGLALLGTCRHIINTHVTYAWTEAWTFFSPIRCTAARYRRSLFGLTPEDRQSDALLHAIVEAFSAWRRKIESSAHVWQSGLSSFRVSSWGLSASTSVPFWLPLAAPDAGIGPDISGHCPRKQDSFWSLLHRRKTRCDMMGEHLAKLHNFKLQPQCALVQWTDGLCPRIYLGMKGLIRGRAAWQQPPL